ncbi:hypothetical protein OSB04_014018 [Centaurea solstitialis]|uniref:PGG domain-containing protein n=1 Tax=Centaurea solstitialis TaxID=347529 RepID=A0AA38TG45_9ASTR|nr:hypothetical protein OSB04_014018 [Centaurea solstitialis]
MDICIPLCNKLIIGDWEAANGILDGDSSRNLLDYSITENKQTALHIAAVSKSIKTVQNLVHRMTEQQLAFQDKDGDTALHDVAKAGNVDMANAMLGKCPRLLTIRRKRDGLPIHIAARYGKRSMVFYLYDKHKTMEGNGLTSHDVHKVFYKCIGADLFDCALLILNDNKLTGFPRREWAHDVLYTLAPKTYAFNDTKSWKITWTPLAKRKSVATILLKEIWDNILKSSSRDEIKDILKGPKITYGNKEETYPFKMLFVAAEMGNTRFLIELIRGYPDVAFKVNNDNQTIFNIAVSHRHEAGMKAASPLKDVSGAAFQMQRELLWFEEVKSKVPLHSREKENKAGHTPRQLFIESHQNMVSDGEKWMKDTASQCMVVAALITTVVFAAAFTFPGGYDENGLPIFLKDGPFIGFIIFDAVSLILSSTSILMFLSILTSRYTHEDFRTSLPNKLMIGLTTLFLSIITMMVVFTISFFVLYRNKLISVPIIIGVVAVVPVVLYMKLQCPLLVDVYRSTYGGSTGKPPQEMSDTNNQPLPDTSNTKLPQDKPDTRKQPPPEMSNTNNQPLHEMSDTKRPQETSDTSNQPVQDGLGQTIPPYNHPCGDLLDDGRRRDYIDICIPLQTALMIGDWEAAKRILDSNRESMDLLGYSISQNKETALHIAIEFKYVKIVEHLVDRMTTQQLALQSKYGLTALYFAAGVGNVNMAKAMVEKCPQLLTIRSTSDNVLPIYVAALYGRRNMVAYLYDNYKGMTGNVWTSTDIHCVFVKCVEADLFDCALKILDDNNQIQFPQRKDAQEVLYVLARKTYAFKDKKSWKVTWLQLAKRESVATELLRRIWKNISSRPSFEIDEILKGPIVTDKDEKATYPFKILYVAAQLGNTSFLVELIRACPDITFTENDDWSTIFHTAVSYRHESIYNLLYEMGSVHDIVSAVKDDHKNNMLHLAGMKPKSPLEDVSGAAFQMQRELLWFEEVNSKVPPYCREEKNDDDCTPLQLFIKNHQDMVSEGEKWMKETASQCMVVAALITTVVFAAAFTFPGGYDQNGLPIFLKYGPFIGFIIFDAVSLILSSTSILMFLSILTSRYTHEDFRTSLPNKLMIGLTTLFLSIITMMVVFTISFFVLYRTKLITIPIIIGVVAVVPVVLYMKLQFPLLVDVYRSTYGSRLNKALFSMNNTNSHSDALGPGRVSRGTRTLMHSDLGGMEYAWMVLYIMAPKTYAFKDMKSWKSSITWVQPTRESSVATELLRNIWKNVLERESDEINFILKGTPFFAVEMGNTNFLVELLRGYPELLWQKNHNRQTIFHVAVSHRHESIYNLMYDMGSLHNIMTRMVDKDGNNMLHLVGMKAETPHKDVLGAVFQMQHELLWFKKNHVGRTPLQLFIENHQDMVSEGEKWMKETANQCMVVAALVTTVVFAVAFTIPGGYDQNNGYPIFLKDGPFIMFVITDAISLILSSASILMFLSILTSRYAQEDFLPIKEMSDTSNQPLQKMSDTNNQPLQKMSDTSNQPLQKMSDTSNPPLHEIPDTSNQAATDSTHHTNPEQSIPPNNQPCEDLLDERRRRDYMRICVPLFHASIIGDQEEVEKILAVNSEFKDLLGYCITIDKATTLQIGVFSQSTKLVLYLVQRMTLQQLALQTVDGQTALHYVAMPGNVDMARAMVERCPQLLRIREKDDWLPIYMAAVRGKHNMVAYFYGEYKSMGGNDWTNTDIHEVFYRCIIGDLFDLALKILDDNNEIGFPQMEYAHRILYVLARKTYAFKDMKSWKNSIAWVLPTRESNVATRLLRKIWKNILERPSKEINVILLGPLQVPFVAAEMGNTNFLVELARGHPEVLFTTNDNKQNIFHIAISHRHESIYNLLYEIGSIHTYVTCLKDKDGNNMLHLTGMKAKTPHEDVSGVVFQMQRELLWFKEVNSKLPTYCREEKNEDGRTPLQLFIENHQYMVSEGEKWMKETANQCMVVAALVTTVVFSVAFTIPGGYDQNNGLPVFLKVGAFRAFVILDAISLILSSASIIMFLSILTSRYAQDDFLVALPEKLMIGLTTLFLSIITMMVAFSVSFFVLYHNKLISIPIIISVGAIVPIYLYMKLQFPLLWDAYCSTYASRGGFKCEPLFGCEREDNRERDTWQMTRRHVRSTADD